MAKTVKFHLTSGEDLSCTMPDNTAASLTSYAAQEWRDGQAAEDNSVGYLKLPTTPPTVLRWSAIEYWTVT